MLSNNLTYYEKKIKNSALLMIWMGWVAAVINIPLILQLEIFNNNIVAEAEFLKELFTVSILFQLVLFTIYLIYTRIELVNLYKAALTLIFLVEISVLFYFNIDFNTGFSGIIIQEYHLLIMFESLKILTLISYAVSELMENFIDQEEKSFYLSQFKIKGETNE